MRRENRKDQSKNPKEILKKRRRILTDEQIQEQIDKSIEMVNKYNKKTEQIRKRRKGKSVEEYKKELNDQKRKIEVKNTTINTLSTATLLIIVAVISFLFARYSSIIGISVNKDTIISEYSSINMVTTVEDKFFAYDKELLSYNNQSLKTYDKNGKVTWEYTFEEKFTPSIFVNDKYMVIANNSSGVVYFFSGKKEVFNKRIDGEIENIFLEENGNIAIEYSTSGYKKIIGVYNNKGDHLYNAYISSDILVGVNMLKNSTKLLLIKVNSLSFKTGITISMLDVNKENSEPYDLVTIDNSVLYDYKINGNNLIMLLDSGIKCVDLNTSEIKTFKEYDSNQVLYISLSDNYFSLVEKRLMDTEESYTIESFKYNENNIIIGTKDIETSPKMFKSCGLINYLVFQNKLSFYNKWGINIKNIDVEYPPKEIVPFRDGRSLALIYTNKIYFIKI